MPMARSTGGADRPGEGGSARRRDWLEAAAPAFVAALCAAFALLGLFNIPSADDFNNAATIREVGAVPYAVGIYRTWSGRLFSSLMLGITFRYYVGFAVSSVFLALSFVAIPIMALASIGWRLARPRSSLFQTLVAFLYGLRPYIDESVFWPTGGWVYVFCLSAYFLWLLVFMKALESGSRILWSLSLVSGVLIGTANEQLTLPFIALSLFATRSIDRKTRSRARRSGLSGWKSMLPIVAIVVGTLILIAAPGNYIRAQAVPSTAGVGIVERILSMATAFCRLSFDMIARSVLAIIGGVFAGIAFRAIEGFGDRPAMGAKESYSLSFLLFTCALLTQVPLVPFSAFAAPRTRFFGAVFLFFSALLAAREVARSLCAAMARPKGEVTRVLLPSLLVAAIVAIPVILIEVGLAVTFRTVVEGLMSALLICMAAFLAAALLLFIVGRFPKPRAILAGFFDVAARRQPKFAFSSTVALIALAAVLAVWMLVPQYRAAIPYRAAGDARRAFMEAVSAEFREGSVVAVPKLSARNPSWFFSHDLTGDAENWVNKGVAAYYKLGDRKIALESESGAE
jgi:hypothetical protein